MQGSLGKKAGLWLQWAALALVLGSALALARAGGRFAFKDLLWVFAATGGYSVSDIGATRLVRSFEVGGAFQNSVFAVCLSYLFCGALTLIYFTGWGRPKLKEARGVLPYSVTWFLSFICLFASFAEVGFVVGNIAQSSRGLISILLGVLIASLGFQKLEERISRNCFMKRMAAGVVMLIAIGAFTVFK